MSNRGIRGTRDRLPKRKATRQGVDWARLDSNQGATDYESAALTTELRAREASVTQTFDGSGLRFTVKRRGEPPVG